MSALIDLTGQRFGKLTVVERASNSQTGSRWLCQCDCGNTHIVKSGNLRNGSTISCGCMHIKHGLVHTRIYNIWAKMKERCSNSHNKDFPRYGGRGIFICEEWLEFKAFYDWSMANGYEDHLQIDRKHNDGPYSPDNCRWTTVKINSNNKRNNHFITYKGETKTIAQWSEVLGINQQTLATRIVTRGWDVEKAFTTPIYKRGRHYAHSAH